MRGGKTSMIECILFDSDGTLVDSELLGFEAMVEALSELGVSPDVEWLHQHYRGWKFTNILDALKERYGIEYPDDFEARFRQRQLALFERRLQPIPGVVEVLPQLQQVLAVVTSGPLVKVNTALRVAGIAEYFSDRVYSAYELGIWKPDPRIYTRSAQDLGFSSEKCVVVEDSAIGLEAAVASGMTAIHLDRFDEPAGHDKVIAMQDMRELPSILGAL